MVNGGRSHLWYISGLTAAVPAALWLLSKRDAEDSKEAPMVKIALPQSKETETPVHHLSEEIPNTTAGY